LRNTSRVLTSPASAVCPDTDIPLKIFSLHSQYVPVAMKAARTIWGRMAGNTVPLK
jgi:hypothetical protein